MGITVRVYSGPAPKPKPKAGDLKTLKDGTVMIRQQVHTGWGWQVSNGRPVWQWVVKGSEDDRMAKIDRLTTGDNTKHQGGAE